MIKNRLLQIRLQKGYKKQKDFAELLGMNNTAYNLIENNRKQVTLETAIDIANKLHMHVDEIFYKSSE